MSLGSLVLNLVTDSAAFVQGLDKAQMMAAKAAKRMKTSMGDIVTGMLTAELTMKGLEAATAGLGRTFETVSEMMKASEGFGSTPEKLYAMKRAAEEAGQSFEQLPDLLNEFNQNLAEIGQNAEGEGAILKELGLDFKKLQQADPSDAFKQLGQALLKVEDPALRLRLASKFMGEEFKEGAGAFYAFARAGETTSRVSTEQMQAISNLSKQWTITKGTLGEAALLVTATVAPTFGALIDQLFGAKNATEGLSKSTKESLNFAMRVAGNAALLVKGAFLGVATAVGHAGLALAKLFDRDFDGAWKAVTDGAQAVKDQVQATKSSLAEFNAESIKAEQHARSMADAQNGQAKATGELTEAQKKQQAALQKLLSEGDKADTSKAEAAANAIKQAFEQIENQLIDLQNTEEKAAIEHFKKLEGVAKDAKLVARYTVEVDKLQAAKAAKSLDDVFKDLNARLQDVGADDKQKALNELARQLDKDGVSAEKAAEALEYLGRILDAEDVAKYEQGLKELNLELEKIGKSAKEQAELDIEFKYGDNPERMAEQFAKNNEKFAKQAKASADEILKDLTNSSRKALMNEDQAELFDYIERLREQAGGGLLPQDEVERITKAHGEYKRFIQTVSEGHELFQDFSSSFLGEIEAVATGAKSGSDAIDDMGKAIQRMAVKALLLKPLEAQLKILGDAFNDWLGGISGGGGSGGGLLGAVAAAFGFGGGKALGGAVAPGTMYEVAERGPELAEIGGRTFMLTGSQGGQVTPLTEGSGGGVTITQHITVDARGADAAAVEQRINVAMARAKEEAVAEVQAKANRGGSFARSLGRA